MWTAARRRRQKGFTLLEVIIALAIAGLGLVALFEAVSGGLLGVESAARHTTAVRHAQSRLAELGITLPLKPGEQGGVERDGYRWRITVTPIMTYARGETRGAPGLTLFAVKALVTWPAGSRQRSVHLDSLRLGPTITEAE